jgi:hypothetical protein
MRVGVVAGCLSNPPPFSPFMRQIAMSLNDVGEVQEKVSSSVWPICTATIVRADRSQGAVYNKPSYSQRITKLSKKES